MSTVYHGTVRMLLFLEAVCSLEIIRQEFSPPPGYLRALRRARLAVARGYHFRVSMSRGPWLPRAL